MTPHEQKYDELARWLGIDALLKLVPFSYDAVQRALAEGDKHLNTLPLKRWDAQHGVPPGEVQRCPTCKQVIAQQGRDEGVWGLIRLRLRQERRHGGVRKRFAWSLSDTVCVLKHAAKFHLKAEGGR